MLAGNGSYNLLRTIAQLLLCITVAVASAARFLPRQSLWTDEVTQLTGLKMPPGDVVAWLTGRVHVDAAPADRMPPLSYWAGQGWSAAFGGSETSMRWFGVACTALAAAVVFAAGKKAAGGWAGLAAGILFASGPNVINLAVEIRAYPLFMLASAGAVYFLIGGAAARSRDRGRLIGMVVCCIIAMYVHFFGVVLAGAMLIAEAVGRWRRGAGLRDLFIAAGAMLLAAAGLWPFVTASAANSAPAGSGAGQLADLPRLAYRLVGHPAMSVHAWMAAAALAGVAIALAAIIGRACAKNADADQPEGRGARPTSAADLSVQLLAALVAGFIAVTVATLMVRSFASATPHYNCWMLPCLAVLLACGAAPAGATNEKRWWRWSGWAGIALLLAANFYADANLARQGEYFAHGPYERLAAMLRDLPDGPIAIVHEPNSQASGGVYYTVNYLLSAPPEQYLYDGPDNGVEWGRQVDVSNPTRGQRCDLDGLSARYLVIIGTRNLHANEVAAAIRGSAAEMPAGPAAEALGHLLHWRWKESRQFVSLVGMRVDVLVRKG